jgi:hypothetical protein
MSLSAEAVTKILESRFDWYSARAVLRQAAERIGAPAAGPFDAKALGGLADALPALGTQVEGVVAALRNAAESAGKAAPAHAPAPKAAEPAPSAEPAAEAATADAPGGDAGDDKKDPKKDVPKKK